MPLMDRIFGRHQSRRSFGNLPHRIRSRLTDETAQLDEEERAIAELLKLDVPIRLSLIDEETATIIPASERAAFEASLGDEDA